MISIYTINAVVFDMDGTLVDTEIVYINRKIEFYKEYGITLPRDAANRQVGLPARECWRITVEATGLDWSFDKYMALYGEYIKNYTYDYRDMMNPHVKSTLDFIKGRYKLALASSTENSLVRKILTQCGLIHYFDVIFTGDMFQRSKPDPEIYVKTVAAIDEKPENCIAIEDSTYGVQSALGAGMIVAGKQDPRFHFDQKGAHYQFYDLTEIPYILKSNIH